jgi:DNA-binding transcriptional ArsR family regulator
MPEDHQRAPVAGVVLAVVAGAACCALPVIVASGALATLGTWLVNPVAGSIVGFAVVVVVVAALRARGLATWPTSRPSESAMTQPDNSADRPAQLATGDPVDAAVRRHALTALLDDRPLTIAELADATALPAAVVERALATLQAGGALEVDDQGRVTGVHGLTRRRTRHRIIASQRTWNTWCALDAIGIPAALRLDAAVRTVCPACNSEISLRVHDGDVIASTDEPRLWLPGGACAHVMDDFCATANLFCNVEHLEHWRHGAGTPAGQPLRLDEAARHGRRVWADVTDCC